MTRIVLPLKSRFSAKGVADAEVEAQTDAEADAEEDIVTEACVVAKAGVDAEMEVEGAASTVYEKLSLIAAW